MDILDWLNMKQATLYSIVFILSLNPNEALSQETCLKNAWEAYNMKDWKLAIDHSEDCTFNFGPQAQDIQNQLSEVNYRFPSNYEVPGALSPQDKAELVSHGLLNDVATAYWIVGMANLRLRNTKEANSAFKKVQTFTFALCYDPEKNLFWSLSLDAELRIKE